MARFILKWRYLKSGKRHSRNVINYIATREGVEKCDEAWKQKAITKEQEKMIQELLADFPDVKDSFAYQEYAQSKNRYTASQLITKAIDENVDAIGKRENYVKYIALRPRVEKDGAHGLFSMTDEPISLSKVADEAANHDGQVWTMIFSLRRADAARLGYDCASAWKALLREQSTTLAKHMKVPMEDLKWYAAFHNEGGHPHVHLVAYSKGKQPYMTKKGLESLKSAFANEVFKQELYHVFVEQTQVRDELRDEGKKKAAELIHKIQSGGYKNEKVEMLLTALTKKLKTYKGKRVYGYLPKEAKNLIDEIVNELAKDERVKELYELWYQEKDKVVGIYQDVPANRVPLSRNEEFKSIRNAVAKEVFEAIDDKQKSVAFAPVIVRLFHHLSQTLQARIDDYYSCRTNTVDKKLRKQIDDKKKAQGLKQE